MINSSISEPDIMDISLIELRRNLSAILHQVTYSDIQFRLKIHNKPGVRIVSETFIKSLETLLLYEDGLRETFEIVLQQNLKQQMVGHSQNDVQNGDAKPRADFQTESHDL